MSDVWYNIGQLAIGIGDLSLANQAFKVAVSLDSSHADAFNNLGVRCIPISNIIIIITQMIL